MKEFPSLLDFSLFLIEREIVVRRELERGLDQVLAKIAGTAKSEFGVYQPATGPFAGWEQLTVETQEQRQRLGFTPNDPLLRTGGLQASIERERDGLEGVVGSRDDVMLYQEIGTKHIPPRPVLGPAAYRNKDAIEALIGKATVAGLVGGGLASPALGYNFEI